MQGPPLADDQSISEPVPVAQTAQDPDQKAKRTRKNKKKKKKDGEDKLEGATAEKNSTTGTAPSPPDSPRFEQELSAFKSSLEKTFGQSALAS